MGQFQFEKTALDGALLITPKVYPDARGSFCETYHEADFGKAGIFARFIQHNQSVSKRGVIRGLHFQKQHPQAKLVWVPFGEVFDVAVDLRPQSHTFQKWHGIVLSGDNRRMLYLPEGFAHGFYVLSDTAVFSYACTRYYEPDDEGAIRWDDPDLCIDWPLPKGAEPILSRKDKHNPFLREALEQLK